MPVVIQELIVRVIVDDAAKPAAAPPASEDVARERAALVQACVTETLKVLRKAKER